MSGDKRGVRIGYDSPVLYRYLMDLEIDGVERGHLADAIEDEDFPLSDAMGADELDARIRSGRLAIDAEMEERLEWFGRTIEILSIYLSTYVTGLEIAESRDESGTRDQVEVLKYVGRKGEVIAVPVTWTVAFPSGEIEPGEEDEGWLERNWSALPRWAQDAYRLKFPMLRRL